MPWLATGQKLDMAYIDVFNGDADGLCALHQLRLADPQNSTLNYRCQTRYRSGKTSAGDERRTTVTILDVSLDKNRDALYEGIGYRRIL